MLNVFELEGLGGGQASVCLLAWLKKEVPSPWTAKRAILSPVEHRLAPFVYPVERFTTFLGTKYLEIV